MKVRTGTRAEPYYRIVDDDLWEPWEHRCDACGMRVPWGDDLCDAHRIEAPEPLPHVNCLHQVACRMAGYCLHEPHCGTL